MEGGMRLITIGCSNTYGQALPDCAVYEPLIKKWHGTDKPSKFAFPQLLADKLGCDLHNLSVPGGSNRHIWWEAINFDFHKDDIVILVWTFPNRHALISPNHTEHLGCWPSAVRANRDFQRYVASSNSNLDLNITSYLYMDHINKHLQGRVSKILNYRVEHELFNDVPDWCCVNFIDALNSIVREHEQDFAIDNIHYGVESHKRFAIKMFEDLTKHSN